MRAEPDLTLGMSESVMGPMALAGGGLFALHFYDDPITAVMYTSRRVAVGTVSQAPITVEKVR